MSTVTMTRRVMWQFEDGPGVELLALSANDSVSAESTIVRRRDGDEPFAVSYRLECDRDWRVRSLVVELVDRERALALRSDGAGGWTKNDGEPLPALDDAIDVDLSATAFTNTLPVRRLKFSHGHSETITVAYIDVPELTLERAEQRYTCLESAADGARYLFESVSDDGSVGYSAELELDGDGLVIHYPGYARRVYG